MIGGWHCATQVHRISIICIVCSLVLRIAEIECVCEVSCDVDGRHAIRHDVVATLCEDIAVVCIEVLGGAIAVGHVVVLI